MNAAAEELYSLLVPLAGDRLIVPRACVAEVVRYVEPKQRDGARPWMLGDVDWNGRPLPVVAFEGALGNEMPVATGRTRIVVFYASTGKLRNGFFGLLTQGFPQLVRVNKDVLKLEAKEGWPEDAPVHCRVRMINEFPLIPDLEKLELMLAGESEQA
ncbi:MAG: chemotaxis protein CheW [Woeseiaceae bacterium]